MRLTLAVAVVTAVTSAAGLGNDAVQDALQRDPDQMRSGEWWRIVTPLLVQPSGWGQFAFNLLGIVLVGVAVERRYGRVRWLLVYLAAGVAGVVSAVEWTPHDTGGGSSDAVAGLVGALALALWLDRRRPWWPGLLYAAFFPVYLTLLDTSGVAAAAVGGNAAVLLVSVLASAGRVGAVRVLLCAAVLAGGVTLFLARDNHGVGLLVGLALGGLLLRRRPILLGRRTARWPARRRTRG